jgi:hypothetical protein
LQQQWPSRTQQAIEQTSEVPAASEAGMDSEANASINAAHAAGSLINRFGPRAIICTATYHLLSMNEPVIAHFTTTLAVTFLSQAPLTDQPVARIPIGYT